MKYSLVILFVSIIFGAYAVYPAPNVDFDALKISDIAIYQKLSSGFLEILHLIYGFATVDPEGN